MTFAEIVQDVMDRLNLTSEEAAERITREVGQAYRRVTSSIGLITSRRTRVTATTTSGSRDLTFSGIEKVEVVGRTVAGTDRLLQELTYDEMLVEPLVSGAPTKYAVKTTTASSVTVTLNSTAGGILLFAEAVAKTDRVAPDAEPAFPESFHDVLIYAVLADEFRKMEETTLLREALAQYEARLSDLRMFLAKSAYLEIAQGKLRRPWAWWETRRKF